MSRSKHTDPKAITAERRLRWPRDGRGTGDLSRRDRLGRMLKELGIVYEFDDGDRHEEKVKPRIIIRQPKPGFLNPASKEDITRLLEFVGPEATYGLQRIEYVLAPSMEATVFPPLGRLKVPGCIVLYQQPIPPWRLSGIISASDANYCRLAGAIIEINQEIEATVVDWPGDTLRNFFLFDVLLHEVGHHILQHYKGKRTKRIVRTRDHEAFAEVYVKRYRAAWFEEQSTK